MAALSRAYPDADWRSAGRSSRWASAAIVVALHVSLVMALLQFESVRMAVTAAAPVMVNLIAPTKPEVVPKPPPPPPPQRELRHKPPPTPQPIITAQPEAPPTTYTAPPPTAAPVALPAIEAPVAPLAVPPATEPAPTPVTPPAFNAAYLNNPAPAYPLISRQMGEEGRAVLRVFVNEHGQPQEVQVRTSSGFSRLDEAAKDTVRQWKFVPAKRGDIAIGAWVLVPISFSLRS
jgi:periplasmic protein TonB